MRRVVVTGMRLISPLGNDPARVFDRLLAGDSGITRLPESFKPAHIAYRRAGRLRRRATVSSTATAYAESYKPVCAWRMCAALAEAQLALDDEDPDEIGVAIGTGMGEAQSTDEGYQRVYEQHSDRPRPQPSALKELAPRQ